MELVICERSDEFDHYASAWCQRKVQAAMASSIFVPAGQTPVGLYKIWEADRPAYLEGIELLQIDDVLSGEQKGLFRSFFESNLPSYATQIRYIETGAQGADLGILGLGLNGHIAFHEPGVDSSLYSACVKLGDTTCEHLGLERDSWGISYGAAAFQATKSLLIMVKGRSKREILKRLLARDVTVPASLLLDHPDITVVVDREAYPC